MAKCGKKCEIYSRVTGYMRPVNAWNKGKREEFGERKTYKHPVHMEKEVTQ